MSTYTARDWLDPTRLYDPRLPAGRLMYFWGGTLYPLILIFIGGMVLALIESFLGYHSTSPLLDTFLPFMYFGYILLGILIVLRRLKDLGRSGWYVLLLIIPFVNLILGLMLVFSAGVSHAPQIHTSTSTSPQASIPGTIEINYCSDCGAKLQEDARYCMQCGAQVPS